MTDQVAIRRKSDGLYLVSARFGSARFETEARFVKSRAKAETIIRVDLGDDLAAYQIIPRARVSAKVP